MTTKLVGVKRVAYDALQAANAAPFSSDGPACGCGRAYVVLSSENTRETVNAVSAMCKKLGLMFLRRAYGVGRNAIYIGYDNADGKALAKSKAFAAELTKHGIKAY